MAQKWSGPTSADGANYRACDGDERRGYGQARGAKKPPLDIPPYEKVDDTDRVFWSNTFGKEGDGTTP